MHGVEFALLLHRALEARVQDLQAAASGEGGFADAEVLHQTRVACRRLRAVVDLLDPGTYASQGAKAKALRRFSKNLGATRELDVLLQGLQDLLGSASNDARRAALEHVLETAARRRRRALSELDPKVPDFAKLLRVPSLPEPFLGPSVGTCAWACLKPRIEEALPAAEALREREDAAALHAARVKVKQLRDTLEALVPAFPAEPSGFLAELRAMQKALGDHHDLSSLEAFLEDRQGRLRKAGRDTLAAALEEPLERAAGMRRAAYEAFRSLDGPWDAGEFSARVGALLGAASA